MVCSSGVKRSALFSLVECGWMYSVPHGGVKLYPSRDVLAGKVLRARGLCPST